MDDLIIQPYTRKEGTEGARLDSQVVDIQEDIVRCTDGKGSGEALESNGIRGCVAACAHAPDV